MLPGGWNDAHTLRRSLLLFRLWRPVRVQPDLPAPPERPGRPAPREPRARLAPRGPKACRATSAPKARKGFRAKPVPRDRRVSPARPAVRVRRAPRAKPAYRVRPASRVPRREGPAGPRVQWVLPAPRGRTYRSGGPAGPIGETGPAGPEGPAGPGATITTVAGTCDAAGLHGGLLRSRPAGRRLLQRRRQAPRQCSTGRAKPSARARNLR